MTTHVRIIAAALCLFGCKKEDPKPLGTDAASTDGELVYGDTRFTVEGGRITAASYAERWRIEVADVQVDAGVPDAGPEPTRSTGYIAFKKSDADPVLAKQQAIEAARAAGILGLLDGKFGCDRDHVVKHTPTSMWCERSDGTRDGPYREWNASGELVQVGGYVNGAKHGDWTKYGDGSSRDCIESYRSGKPRRLCDRASRLVIKVDDIEFRSGQLTEDAVRAVIEQKRARILNCYEKELLVSPGLFVRTDIHVRYDKRGAAESANPAIPGAGPANMVARCVAAAFKQAGVAPSKPPKAAEVVVGMTFDLEPCPAIPDRGRYRVVRSCDPNEAPPAEQTGPKRAE